ncbi:MAG: electron transfer flavoprotein subunit alpha/FixB family protein [Nitrospinota bacterium]
MMSVIVYLEHHDGNVKESSLQAAGVAVTIAAKKSLPAIGIVIGPGAESAAGSVKGSGLEKICAMEGADYSAPVHAACLADFAKNQSARAIFAAATFRAREFLPMAAAAIPATVAADCIEADAADDGALTFLRPIYAGKLRERIECRSPAVIATLRPNVFPLPDSGGEAAVENVEPPTVEPKSKMVEFVPAAGGRPELTEARVIVSGGRGIADPKNYEIIETLADSLGAATGASRAVVDAGWKDHSFQVGQTGKTVSPELYVAVGISGAIQHLAGMSSSKRILAINKDSEANIFTKADYGIVGDLFEVVPKLIDAINKAK